MLVADFCKTTYEQGDAISSVDMRKKMGMDSSQKFDVEHMRKHPDWITFRTYYINEIPLYDTVTESVINPSNESKLTFKKFEPRNFSVKQQNPTAQMETEPHVVLSYGVDVMSMFFSFDRPLNSIITLYDSKAELTDQEVQTILYQTKEVSQQAMVFHAEKLTSTLLNIFCKTQTPEGSSHAFEAFLYLIQFFKS